VLPRLSVKKRIQRLRRVAQGWWPFKVAFLYRLEWKRPSTDGGIVEASDQPSPTKPPEHLEYSVTDEEGNEVELEWRFIDGGTLHYPVRRPLPQRYVMIAWFLLLHGTEPYRDILERTLIRTKEATVLWRNPRCLSLLRKVKRDCRL